ncbi:phosphotransferase enzyme family protein [Hymenobacter bucti]|uniref:Phosphotransferase enzyme family protein n=1 Tax=Hymenobacter bucti TaxID=1844114 RepID=A0ABW4QNV9_9BACT
MSTFPTQYSTLSASALATHVSAEYGLPDLRGRYLLRGVSDTYLLENEREKYILKVYRAAHRSSAEIAGEVELLTYLRAQGTPVAAPLPARNGAFLLPLAAAEGERFGVLFTFAPGRVVMDLSDAQLRTVGREMARLHDLTAGLTLRHPRPGYDLESTLRQPLRTLEPAFRDYPEGYAELQALVNQALGKLESTNTADFGYGYCHYDFLPKNFHFDADDRLTFFDFDFAGPGYLVNDVMTIFVHFFLHRLHHKVSAEEATRAFAVFVAGYREVRPLSEAELAAIPYLRVGFWLFYFEFAYRHFDDWSNTFFGPRYLRERLGWIKQWAAWYSDFS